MKRHHRFFDGESRLEDGLGMSKRAARARRSLHRWVLAALALAAVMAGSAFAATNGERWTAPVEGGTPAVGPSVTVGAQESTPASHVAGFDPLSTHLVEGRLVSELPNGRTALLTLDPGLQAHVESILARYEVPFGALVAIEPATGRVLAYASHSSADANAGDLARNPSPPSASVFKIITAAALVDAGLQPDTRTCYSGGFHRITASDLESDGRQCATLSEALGGSINTVFAKLADQHLEHERLQRFASAFGFGHALPFDAPMQPSAADMPDDRLEFARTAAGFWHSQMSPLHAAMIAATIANDGVMQRVSMIERLTDRNGKVVAEHEPRAYRSVIERRTAELVSRMMERTVTHGTARSAFYDERGNPFLPGIRVAGKTGSLDQSSPYRAYSWWVGHAPANRPTIAVAALIGNTPLWRIKGSYLAREALRHYLVEKPARERALAARAN